jgi:acyl-CoA reductase-like NAD-dependent aldehyde dehydrogenase
MKKTLVIAALAFSAGLATQAFAERQPMMQKALNQLEDAKRALEAATADKGGHRVKAIEHVNLAIAEVRAGIEFDNKR